MGWRDDGSYVPCGPDVGRLVTTGSIITEDVKKAGLALDAAIKQAVASCSLERDLAQAQLSSFLCSAWNRMERHLQRIPARRDRVTID
jgi:hypothetical protein